MKNNQPVETTTSTTTPPLPPIEETTTSDPSKVLVDKVTLDNILERLAAVEQNGSGAPRTITINRNRTAKVRFVDEDKTKLVVGYGKSWDKVELGGKRHLVLQVFTKDPAGKKETHEVKAVEFMEQGPFLEGEILNVKTQEKVQELGFVNETKVDYDNYRSYQTDKQVPIKVVSNHSIYTLKLSDGREVEVPEEGLN